MRFVEIRGNILVPMSNEEAVLLEKVRGSVGPVQTRTLNEREQELARNMVHRGILDRTKVDGASCLIYNDLEDSWRL